VLFVAANTIALIVLSVAATRKTAPTPTVAKAFQRIYAELSEEDRATLAQESTHAFMYEPFTQFRERASIGRFVNVDPSGFRLTQHQGPWPPDPRYCNVFLFGSSTTFGYGVADEHTIASYLQELLSAVGLPRAPRVYNFGRGGYYSTQERILFEQLALAGHVPDLAIFIDGPSDLIFAYGDRPILTGGLEQCVDELKREAAPAWRPALAALPLNRALALFRPAAGAGLPSTPAPASSMRPPAHDDPAVAARVIAHYTMNKRLTEGTARAIGVTPVFVWQPIPMYKYDLQYHVHPGSFGAHEYSRFGYPRVAEYVRTHDMGASFVWCADIQEGIAELLYVDQMHYAPALSKRLAACITTSLRERDLLRCTAPRGAPGR
jgi:hypothetical protein